jgi:hypothetical protein
MTAIETAMGRMKSALELKNIVGTVRVRASDLRALIAEHERVTADLAMYQDHAGLTFPRPLKFEPPTDDEREALTLAFFEWINEGWLSAGTDQHRPSLSEYLADAVLAAGFRRQGPITDEWEYGIAADGDDHEPFTDHYSSIEDMSDEFDGSLAREDEHLVRRRKAGPWEPVDAS